MYISHSTLSLSLTELHSVFLSIRMFWCAQLYFLVLVFCFHNIWQVAVYSGNGKEKKNGSTYPVPAGSQTQ